MTDQATTQAIVPIGEGATAPAPILTNEWEMIQAQAAVLARTNFVPKQYRGKPDDIIAAALWGRELGFGVTTSLSLIDVIEGNPELNAEGKVALFRCRGHSIQGEVNKNGATVTGIRADNGDSLTVTFTFADATAAKITGNPSWQKYREDMLWARAVTRLGRRLFGDVLQGFSYSAEEIESFMGNGHDEIVERPAAKPIPMVRRRPDLAGTTPAAPPAPAPPVPPAASDVVVVVDAELVEDDEPTPEPEPEAAQSDVKMASPAQQKFLAKLLSQNGIDNADRDAVHAKVGELLGRKVESLNELTSRDASRIIDHLNQ